MARQRPTSPVFGDPAEHPMFDFIPLAGPGWKMTDGDAQSGLFPAVSELVT